jgi:hypothetical protein
MRSECCKLGTATDICSWNADPTTVLHSSTRTKTCCTVRKRNQGPLDHGSHYKQLKPWSRFAVWVTHAGSVAQSFSYCYKTLKFIILTIPAFWYVKTCNLDDRYQCFGVTCHLHLQDRRGWICDTRNKLKFTRVCSTKNKNPLDSTLLDMKWIKR